MKFLFCIIIVFAAYTNRFYTWSLPTNFNDVSKENVDFDEEILTLENSLPSAKFNPEHIGGHYQGDMIFPDEESIKRGAASRPSWQRWPNGIIPYDMTPSISDNHSALIVDAMRLMEDLTQVDNVSCIQFRPKTDEDEIFITIQNGSGCSAYVGYLQNYTLNRTVTLMHAPRYTCMITGIIQHELLHVLGFFHEQSRPDRDDYVSIQWQNIINGTGNNFAKYTEEDIDTLMLPYDYGSVMHYGAYDFSSNGLPTIIPTPNASVAIGQRDGMSPIDILEVQRYYGCVPTPTTTDISATNPSTAETPLTTENPSTATTTTFSTTANPSITTTTTTFNTTANPSTATTTTFNTTANPSTATTTTFNTTANPSTTATTTTFSTTANPSITTTTTTFNTTANPSTATTTTFNTTANPSTTATTTTFSTTANPTNTSTSSISTATNPTSTITSLTINSTSTSTITSVTTNPTGTSPIIISTTSMGSTVFPKLL